MKAPIGGKPVTVRKKQSLFHVLLTQLLVCSALLSLPPYEVRADQSAAELDTLFKALGNATSNYETNQIQNEIWQQWLIAPDDNANLLMSQLHAAMSSGQHKFALEICNQLVDSNPEYAEAWNKRATVHYLMGSHALSIADIKQTLLLEPRHFGALSGLGLIFTASGQYEAALDAFNEVLKISPASANAKGSVEHVQSLLGTEI
jgi:tetratricopeptide (TPR) repeat protein